MAGFFIDHNVSLRMAELLRERGHEAAIARELGWYTRHSRHNLQYCKAHELVLLCKAYPSDHFVSWTRRGK
jgi:hypothetical protein